MLRKFGLACGFFVSLVLAANDRDQQGAQAQAAEQAKNVGEFVLFENGEPLAEIVVLPRPAELPKHRIGSQRHLSIPEDVPSDLDVAIELWQEDIGKHYGIALPLAGTAETTMPNRVVIEPIATSLEDEDRVEITFPEPGVMVMRGGESGLVRALFRLMEDYAGARYLFQGEPGSIGIGAHYPALDRLAIPAEAISYESAFPLQRAASQTTYGSHWPRKSPMNRTYWMNWEGRLGTKARVPLGHDLADIAFPVDRYEAGEFTPDPDIFPIQHGERLFPWGGRARRNSHWQPRYSSEAAVDEAVRNLLEFLDKNPDVTGISLGVNDGGGYCETEQGRESETYYAWVNAVAERITEIYPNMRFGVIAYREVSDPPPFKLHPNVVVFMTFDLHATMDSDVRERRLKWIRDWADKANIGAYTYNSGEDCFTLPRIYFAQTDEMVKALHEHGAVGMFTERGYNAISEGPKLYLYYRLLENPALDYREVVADWCRAAVGDEAAPYLEKYYAFWENFWQTKAIHSSWWKGSKNNIYLSLPAYGTYMQALEAGDIEHCRNLMEKVVGLAHREGTPEQAKRADLLMAYFEWYEANAIASSGAYFNTDGRIPDAGTAVAFLRNLPQAAQAYERAKQLPGKIRNWIAPRLTIDRLSAADVVVGSFAAVTEYLNDPAVLAELETLAGNTELPSQLRFLARIMLRSAAGDEGDNLVPDGTFATDDHGWKVRSPLHGTAERCDEHAFVGTHSLKCTVDHPNYQAMLEIPGGKPDTDYYLSARVFIPENQAVAEGRLNLWGQGTYWVGDNIHNRGRTRNIVDVSLKPGQWTYVSAIIPGAKLTDSLRAVVHLRSFENGDVVFIDDVRIYEIPAEETE